MLLLRTLALAAAGTAAAGTTTIAFGPPVTIGHAGNIATSEQFPSGALAAIQYAGEHGGAARVLARGTTASAAWRVQNVSKMAVREPQCVVDPAACPGVCNVKTRWTKRSVCPDLAGDYGWSGPFAPDLAVVGDDLVDFGRLSPDDMQNRSWTAPNRSRYSLSRGGRVTVATEATVVRFTGLPRSAQLPPQTPAMIRLMGASWLDIGGGKQLQTAMIKFNSTGQSCPTANSIVVFVSADGGKTYGYSGMVADAADLPFSQEGPNEHDCALLPSTKSDGGKLIGCAIRLDGGDGPISHPYLPFYWTQSSDSGRSWSKPVAMNGTGCARPRLLLLGDTLLLSGGRMRNEGKQGVQLWSADVGVGSAFFHRHRGGGGGGGEPLLDSPQWTRHDVSYLHNRGRSGDQPAWTAGGETPPFIPSVASSWKSMICLDRVRTNAMKPHNEGRSHRWCQLVLGRAAADDRLHIATPHCR